MVVAASGFGAVASQQEGRRFKTGSGVWDQTGSWVWDLSVWSLHVLPVSAWVFTGYSGFLPQSKNMLRLIGDSKLPVGVNV